RILAFLDPARTDFDGLGINAIVGLHVAVLARIAQDVDRGLEGKGLELALEIAVFLLRDVTDCRHCCLHFCASEDHSPFAMADRAWARKGHLNPLGRSKAKDRSGQSFLKTKWGARSRAASTECASTAGKKVGPRRFWGPVPAHRSYAK